MPVAVIAVDAPDGSERRQALLAAHLAHVERVMPQILVAGPLSGEDGASTGSLLVLDVSDEAAARALMDGDPYLRGGVWERVDYRRFRAVAGGWVGGRNW